jgi:hypothetical protein
MNETRDGPKDNKNILDNTKQKEKRFKNRVELRQKVRCSNIY